jgi:UDP-N-acetylglucosamine acyltransferase
MTSIHPTAQIHSTAQLGADVVVGPFSVIESGAIIGDHVRIGTSAIIHSGAVLGAHCEVGHGSAIGGDPQIMGFNRDIPSRVEIGEKTIMREYVTINRSGYADGVTRVGAKCMLMAYTHVAHDCILDDRVILVNGVGLSGHIVVGEGAFVSGLTGVHQFVRIGKFAMIGGVTAITQDILPFSLVEGRPPRLVGINSVGLKRNQFAPKTRSALKGAVKILKQKDLNTSQAIAQIQAEIDSGEEISYFIDFINNSKRGITK